MANGITPTSSCDNIVSRAGDHGSLRLIGNNIVLIIVVLVLVLVIVDIIVVAIVIAVCNSPVCQGAILNQSIKWGMNQLPAN